MGSSDEPRTLSDAFWRRWCAENTAPRSEADALSLQAAHELVREVETPSFLLGIREAYGRWAIEFGQEAAKSVDYLHPTNEARLRRFLMTRRVVPSHAWISPAEANRIATEHSGLFSVDVSEGGEGTWKYDFRSLIRNHLTGTAATDALGWRYLLDRWDREIEQELASAPSIDTAIVKLLCVLAPRPRRAGLRRGQARGAGFEALESSLAEWTGEDLGLTPHALGLAPAAEREDLIRRKYGGHSRVGDRTR